MGRLPTPCRTGFVPPQLRSFQKLGRGRTAPPPGHLQRELSSAHTPFSTFWPSEPRENTFLLFEATTLGHVITAAPHFLL